MSLVGSYVALSKPLVAALPVFLLAWLRFGIGALAMPHWLIKPLHEPPMTRKTRWLIFLESFLGNFLFTIFMLFGVSMTTAVSAGVIMAAIPTVVALLSWLFLRERIGPRVALAIVLAVLGIGLFSLSKSELSDHMGKALDANSTSKTQWLGNLLVLGAVVCEAAYAVIGKKLTGSVSPKRITALINLWGFALMTPMGLYAAWSFNFGAVAARQLGAVAVLRTGRQCVDGVVVDDRAANRACSACRCFHRDAAHFRRRGWGCWCWAKP
jgi:drug/metabolite transporter (DMT)-like permease